MTSTTFRRVALALPEAKESEHHGHPDFRVKGKIFATLGYPDNGGGMVKLTPEQQASFIASHPEAFSPCAGAWGERGATAVRLKHADRATVARALRLAWRNAAPKMLAAMLEGDA
jgi:hypothetical protein